MPTVNIVKCSCCGKELKVMCEQCSEYSIGVCTPNCRYDSFRTSFLPGIEYPYVVIPRKYNIVTVKYERSVVIFCGQDDGVYYGGYQGVEAGGSFDIYFDIVSVEHFTSSFEEYDRRMQELRDAVEKRHMEERNVRTRHF